MRVDAHAGDGDRGASGIGDGAVDDDLAEQPTDDETEREHQQCADHPEPGQQAASTHGVTPGWLARARAPGPARQGVAAPYEEGRPARPLLERSGAVVHERVRGGRWSGNQWRPRPPWGWR